MICQRCNAHTLVCRCGSEIEAANESSKPVNVDDAPSDKASKGKTSSPKSDERSEIGNPGDKNSIIFKRYYINEHKRFHQYTGFDLYSFKTDGDKQAWQIIKETDEIEGKNNFFKVLFGTNKQGEVYYLNNKPLRTAFDIPFSAGAKKIAVFIQFSVKIDSPAYFLDQHKGHDSLQIGEVVNAISHQLRGYLLTQLQHLAQKAESVIDFSAFNTGLERIARQELESLCLEVVSFSTSGVILPDELNEEVEEKKRQIDANESLETHQNSSSTNIAIHSTSEDVRLRTVQIEAQKTIALKASELTALETNICHEQALVKGENDTEVAMQNLYNQREIDKQRNSNKLENRKHDLEISGVEEEIKKAKMSALLDTDYKYETNKIKIEQARKKAEAEGVPMRANKSNYSLSPFDKVINIYRQEQAVSSLKYFGRYFWNLVAGYSSETDELLHNGQLHYIRYEDPYCNDISSMLLLNRIFEAITGFNCYKPNSERHLIFGKDVHVYPANPVDRLKPSLRNKFLIKLLKAKGHIGVSSKNKTHDRDMALAFSDGAHINLKLSYGLAFWQVDTESLGLKLSKGESTVATDKDINDDFMLSANRFDADVKCQEKEKDTVISVWGWKQ